MKADMVVYINQQSGASPVEALEGRFIPNRSDFSDVIRIKKPGNPAHHRPVIAFFQQHKHRVKSQTRCEEGKRLYQDSFHYARSRDGQH
ncbi:hypothetical protein MN186_01995 [Aliiroseovarius sp. N1F302]|uniref:hypothetical protein n=1 Tax=Aliiroseovarius sediminis TaxID=2925839 RepID=UPI001F5ACD0B|nr:hypothetical protein [Aliiroseovarius sediminis]MCI2393255.1 hypothetical protein [Aliiroseovarius sediminis]